MRKRVYSLLCGCLFTRRCVNKGSSCDVAWSHFSGAVMRRAMRFAASQWIASLCDLLADVLGMSVNAVEKVVAVWCLSKVALSFLFLTALVVPQL
jgi:hypothetical protein